MGTIVKKPWGQEELLEINAHYVVKRLTMKKGHRCSLQYHQKKKETIYVLVGQLRISTGPSAKELSSKVFEPNECLSIEPHVIHRMEAIEDCIYLESSTPQLEDVVRIEDDYLRT